MQYDFRYDMAKGLRPRRSLRTAMAHEIAMYAIVQVCAKNQTVPCLCRGPVGNSFVAFVLVYAQFYNLLPSRRKVSG